MAIGVSAWRDGFELFWDGRMLMRHASSRPWVWMDRAPEPGRKAWRSAGPAFALESTPEKALIAFPGFCRLAFEDEKDTLRLSFSPPEGFRSPSRPESLPSLRLRLAFGFPLGAYGFAPSTAFDLKRRWLRFRNPGFSAKAAESSVAAYPRLFSPDGSWLAVRGGGEGEIKADAQSCEVRTIRPWDSIHLGKADKAWKSMRTLSERLGPRKGCEEQVDDEDPRIAVIKLLSYSFCAETILALCRPGEARLGALGPDRFRYVVETGPFALEYEDGREDDGLANARIDDGRSDFRHGHAKGLAAEGRLRMRALMIHAALQPYREGFSRGCGADGLPYWTHPGIRYCEETGLWSRSDQIMAGEDIFIAPTLGAAQKTRELLLPRGRWVHLWTSRTYPEGRTVVDTPLGNPAVFWREESAFSALFEDIRKAATRL